MQIVNDLKENNSHNQKGAGAYEWWYFDCIDEDNEYSFAARFLKGNPFSADYTKKVKEHLNFPELKIPEVIDFCSLSFSLYFKNRIVYTIQYDYTRDKFSVESEYGFEKIILEKNNFKFSQSENKYYLNINLSTTDLDNKFKAEFVFSVINGADSASDFKSTDVNEKHFWLPAAVVCKVTGKFKFYVNYKRHKTEFNGFGYVDHHWGNDAMFLTIKNWYWGRLISDDYSFVYFYIKYFENDKKPFKKLIIYKDGAVEKDVNDFDIEIKSRLNFSSLNFSKDIFITEGDIKLECYNKSMIDESTNYKRYLSDFKLYKNGKNILLEETGISELISNKKFNPDP